MGDRRWSGEQARFLADVGALLVSFDYIEVLGRIAQLAVPLLGDWCAIVIREETGALRRVAVACADPARRPLADALLHQVISADGPNLAARAVRSARSELHEDLPAEFFQHTDFSADYREVMRQVAPRHMLVVPLLVRDEPRGALTLSMAESGRRFAPTMVDLSGELARRVALAVDNALLYRSTQRRLNELLTVQRVAELVTSALQIDVICTTLVAQLQTVFGYQMASIYLRDGDALHLRAAVGYERVIAVIKMSEGIAGRVARTGEAAFARHAHRDPDFLEAVPGTARCLVVPLRYRGAPPLGVIAIESRGQPQLSDDDFFLLALLADQISVAVLNAQLFARVADSFQRFSSLVELAGSVIICLSPDLRVTEFNREAERVFGRARGQAIGVDYLAEFVDPAERPIFASLATAVLAGRSIGPFETQLRDVQGRERAFLWSIACRHDQAGAAAEVLIVGHDISERRRAEEERLRYERRLQEAQRLESLGVLAGGIAHDFNNLLAVILGHASMLSLELPAETVAGQSAAQIELVAQRAAGLVGQVLAYAGRGRFQQRTIDLSALVAEMASLLQSSIGKQAALRLDLAPDLLPVEADDAQLRQVVMNLIINAADALADRPGTIDITTRARHVDERLLAATDLADDLRPGDYIELRVTDTGVGMDAATRARIFDPFFTTKRAGRGLGLAAVQGIIRRHGGGLHVLSAPGQGSTFSVILPLATAGVPPSAAPESAPAAAADALVLVVDDEGDLRSLVARVLAHAGYRVIAAADGAQALRAAAEQPDLALALVDLTMPGLSGSDLCAALASDAPQVKLVLMSGYPPEDVAGQVGGAPPITYLQKPFRAQELLALVGRLVAGS